MGHKWTTKWTGLDNRAWATSKAAFGVVEGGNLKQPHSRPMSALCPPRPRMPHRLTLRLPRRALIELQSLAAAAETPVAGLARHLLLKAIASAASQTAVD